MSSLFSKSIPVLILGVLGSLSSSAAIIQLGITGNLELSTATISSGSINFGAGTSPDGGPYAAPPGTGNFKVVQAIPGDTFALLGITNGQTGTIQSFDANVPAIPGTFMAFNGNLITMTGTLGDPIFVQNTISGVVVSFDVNGDVIDDGDLIGDYSGVFSATFNGYTDATLFAALLAGQSVHTNYVATFTADVNVSEQATPEPSTLTLMGAAFLGLGLISRRRGFNKVALLSSAPKILIAVAAVALTSVPAKAVQIAIQGNAQIGAGAVKFGLGDNGDGGPYQLIGSFGDFNVMQVQAGSLFQSLGITLNQEGGIRSFAINGQPTSPFMTFNSSTISMTAIIPAGTYGPLIFQDTNFGSIAAFNASGNILNGATVVGTYTGTFTMTFVGMSSEDVLNIAKSEGTVATPFAATFDAVSAVPEPAALGMVGLGLSALVALRRRTARN